MINILLRKREEKHLEAAQMKFLRHLLGITKLDVATTRTEDGHK